MPLLLILGRDSPERVQKIGQKSDQSLALLSITIPFSVFSKILLVSLSVTKSPNLFHAVSSSYAIFRKLVTQNVSCSGLHSMYRDRDCRFATFSRTRIIFCSFIHHWVVTVSSLDRDWSQDYVWNMKSFQGMIPCQELRSCSAASVLSLS